MIVGEFAVPFRKIAPQALDHRHPAIELYPVTLAIVEADGFDARKVIERQGYLSGRRKQGLPMLRVLDGWCVFFNQGCVLHKLGAAEGDAFRYKPVECALFPLAHDEKGRWYVRQHGFKGEAWDLFCLNPKNSTKKASETLQAEIELARRFTERGG